MRAVGSTTEATGVGSVSSNCSMVLESEMGAVSAVTAGLSIPAGASSGVAVVTTGSAPATGVVEGSEPREGVVAFDEEFERPHVHGAYQEA